MQKNLAMEKDRPKGLRVLWTESCVVPLIELLKCLRSYCILSLLEMGVSQPRNTTQSDGIVCIAKILVPICIRE